MFHLFLRRKDIDQQLGSCGGGPRRSCELRRTRGLQQRCGSTIISRYVRRCNLARWMIGRNTSSHTLRNHTHPRFSEILELRFGALQDFPHTIKVFSSIWSSNPNMARLYTRVDSYLFTFQKSQIAAIPFRLRSRASPPPGSFRKAQNSYSLVTVPDPPASAWHPLRPFRNPAPRHRHE